MRRAVLTAAFALAALSVGSARQQASLHVVLISQTQDIWLDVPHPGVRFDLDGDGFVERMGAWPPTGAFLAIDQDGNGRITNGNELIGGAAMAAGEVLGIGTLEETLTPSRQS